jgi:hypothetical protein
MHCNKTSLINQKSLTSILSLFSILARDQPETDKGSGLARKVYGNHIRYKCSEGMQLWEFTLA